MLVSPKTDAETNSVKNTTHIVDNNRIGSVFISNLEAPVPPLHVGECISVCMCPLHRPIQEGLSHTITQYHVIDTVDVSCCIGRDQQNIYKAPMRA